MIGTEHRGPRHLPLRVYMHRQGWFTSGGKRFCIAEAADRNAMHMQANNANVQYCPQQHAPMQTCSLDLTWMK